MDRRKLFDDLFRSYIKAYPTTPKQKIQTICVQFWNSMKEKENFTKLYDEKICELNTNVKTKKSIASFFQIKPQSSNALHRESPGPSKSINVPSTSEPTLSPQNSKVESLGHKCPKQQQLKQELDILNADLIGLTTRKSANILTEDQHREMETKNKRKREIERDIEKKIADQQRQKKARQEKKRSYKKLLLKTQIWDTS